MEIPTNTRVIEWPTSITWWDETGILCSISKKAPVQTLEEAKKTLEDFRALIGNRKVCLLIDVTETSESSKELRDYAATEFPKFIKAMAMISKSVLGKMLANLFFSVKAQPYPAKMFNDEVEAKEWLKQYL
jgi:hypothetical protein